MIRLLLGFIIGLIAGVWGYAWLNHPQSRNGVQASNDSLTASVQQKLSEIRVDDIRQELERTGLVVRQKAGQWRTTLAEAASDAKVTGAIKSKFFAEPGISSMSINVTTTDGLVTLSGTVDSHEQVAKAMRLALETEGVRKVVSTLQVKPPQK